MDLGVPVWTVTLPQVAGCRAVSDGSMPLVSAGEAHRPVHPRHIRY